MTFDELMSRFAALAETAAESAAIRVAGPEAAAYARVLEYGSIAEQPPWPRPGARTVLAVDPETGAQVVVSAQAPQGYIRVRAPEFLAALRDALAQPADWLNTSAIDEHLARSVNDAAAVALELLRRDAPRDSGRLAEALTIVSE
jgi:hypothetical protein